MAYLFLSALIIFLLNMQATYIPLQPVDVFIGLEFSWLLYRWPRDDHIVTLDAHSGAW